MDIERVFLTKSLIDETPSGLIHLYGGNKKTLCGKELKSERWLIETDHDDRPITCKKCLEIVRYKKSLIPKQKEEIDDWEYGCVRGLYCSECNGICPMNHNKELRDKFKELTPSDF